MTEFGFIDRIKDLFATLPDNGFEGIGDDCAVLPLGDGTSLLFTADLLTEGGMELREFADLFGLLLSQYDVSAIPVSLDRVSAGEIQHLSHKEAKVLLLLGADEDHFPLVTQAPGLLTDSDRSWLQAIGLEVAPSADQRLDRCSFTKGWCCPMNSYLSAGPAPRAALPPIQLALWNKSKGYCQN